MTTWLGYWYDWLSGVDPTATVYWFLGLIAVMVVSSFVQRALKGNGLSRRTPILAFAVSVVAGMLIIFQVFAITKTRSFNFEGPSHLRAIFGAIGYTQSVVVFAAAATLLLMPNHRRIWGFLIILFSFASLLVGGGFFLGSIL